jgi:hypothetical protein
MGTGRKSNDFGPVRNLGRMLLNESHVESRETKSGQVTPSQGPKIATCGIQWASLEWDPCRLPSTSSDRMCYVRWLAKRSVPLHWIHQTVRRLCRYDEIFQDAPCMNLIPAEENRTDWVCVKE